MFTTFLLQNQPTICTTTPDLAEKRREIEKAADVFDEGGDGFTSSSVGYY
jgi:hypothetical protein